MRGKDLREYDNDDFASTGRLVYHQLPLPKELTRMQADFSVDERLKYGLF